MNKKHYGLTVLLSLILVLVLGQIPGVGATPAHAAESYKIKTSVSPAGTGNMSVTVNGREATTASPGDKVVVTSRPNNGQVVESLTATENDISTVPDLMDVMGDVCNGGTQYEITENYQPYVLHATDKQIITGNRRHRRENHEQTGRSDPHRADPAEADPQTGGEKVRRQ